MTLSFVLAAPDSARATKIERIITPAGIEVWFVRDTLLPMLSMSFAFRGGASQDPADKAGLHYLAAGLLDEGAGALDANAFQQELESHAISLHFDTNRDQVRGSLKTLTANQDKAFELLGLAVTKPRFDADAVERVRADVLAGLRRRSTDPDEIAQEEWYARAFPDHPYGRPVQGLLDSVPKISENDVRTYSGRVLARSNLKIAVVGDVDGATLAKLLDRAFADLPAEAQLSPVPDVAPKSLGERHVIELNVPQTVIKFGGVGLKRADPDFIPAFVLNHILGGGSFSSRLFREIREKRGLSYSVFTYLAAYDHTGLFLGGVSTRNDRARESLDIIMEEIKRIATEGPSEDELKHAKSFLIGSYALRFDTSGKIASQLLEIQLDNLGIDYIDRRNNLVQAVSTEDVRRAARRLFSDTQLLVLLIGKPVMDSGPGTGGG